MIDLSGQIALVTGAGKGIGKTIAQVLAEHHATVILVARTEKAIQAVARQIILGGGSAEAKRLDISKENEVVSLFKYIVKKYGKLDILINNAGINVRGKLMDSSVVELDEVMRVNVRGTYLCCREGLRVMAPRKSGYIINMSSVMGFRAHVDQALYAASKHAVVGLTKALAIEAKDYNVNISLIHPGAVDTEMGHSARPDLDPIIMIRPEDIAQVVLFLVGLSSFCAIDEVYIRRKSGTPF